MYVCILGLCKGTDLKVFLEANVFSTKKKIAFKCFVSHIHSTFKKEKEKCWQRYMFLITCSFIDCINVRMVWKFSKYELGSEEKLHYARL